MPDCSSIQRSLAWCQGKPELPGVKRRIYYISKYDILYWPVLQHDANGRLTSASYAGDFVLRADAKWKFIDILPDKSQLTSEAQGEYPSQTQLNKLTAVHPGVDEAASAASAYLNNNDNVFLVEDMRGAIRVVGSDKWPTKTTVSQDLGQGATGTTSTTISVEATDECPAPFYAGAIDTDDGTINPEGNPNQATGGGNSGGQNGGNTGGQNSGNTGGVPQYNQIVKINGVSYTVAEGSVLNIPGPIKSIDAKGSNMNNLSIIYDSADENEPEEFFSITNYGKQALWTGNIPSSNTAIIYRGDSADGNSTRLWFKINVTAVNSGGSGGSTSGGGSSSTNGLIFNQLTIDDSNSDYVQYGSHYRMNKTVVINNTQYKITKGQELTINGPLTQMQFKGNSRTLTVNFIERNELERTDNNYYETGDDVTITPKVNLQPEQVIAINLWDDNNRGGTWFTIKLSSSSSDSGNGPVYNNKVKINNSDELTITDGGKIDYPNYLNSLRFTGQDMVGLYLKTPNGKEEQMTVASDGKSASWSGSYSNLGQYSVYRNIGSVSSPNNVLWFKINLFEDDDSPGEGD